MLGERLLRNIFGWRPSLLEPGNTGVRKPNSGMKISKICISYLDSGKRSWSSNAFKLPPKLAKREVFLCLKKRNLQRNN